MEWVGFCNRKLVLGLLCQQKVVIHLQKGNVWLGLELSKFYTLGCPRLYVATDHKPLVGIVPNFPVFNYDASPYRLLFSLSNKFILFNSHY